MPGFHVSTFGAATDGAPIARWRPRPMVRFASASTGSSPIVDRRVSRECDVSWFWHWQPDGAQNQHPWRTVQDWRGDESLALRAVCGVLFSHAECVGGEKETSVANSTWRTNFVTWRLWSAPVPSVDSRDGWNVSGRVKVYHLGAGQTVPPPAGFSYRFSGLCFKVRLRRFARLSGG